MANPRKFSEKIARHNQRQAEETAAFENIMKEVNQVKTNVAPDRDSDKNTLHINTALGAFRGGSLPNVSTGVPIVKFPQQNCDSSAKDEASHPSRVMSFRVEGRSRTRSQSGPMRRHHDRKADTSPYGAYLSPIDTGWVRTKSDSALHQSAMQCFNMMMTNTMSKRR
ncbi:hypothetical protein JTB14_001192 [Gonioctena quinquepunctata]|nr:hypothetical protein JTB14_001192 [Gonioctena quinquepunctata]